MIRPGLTFFLWVAIAALVVVNDTIADTVIVGRLTLLLVEWYKVLVPLPYIAMMAIIHARRTRGPQWLGAALLAAVLWPTTTVIVDYFYEHVTFGQEPDAFIDRFAFWWGAPYSLMPIALFVLPLSFGLIYSKNRQKRLFQGVDHTANS
jgi:hypothetical protein